MALSRARFRVDVATDGVEAVEMFRAKHYDIILMDIQLPRLTGDQATRQIREIETTENRVPVIIFGCTGSLGDSDIANYKLAGMDGVIGKGSVLESAVPEALELFDRKPGEFIVVKLGGIQSPIVTSSRTLSTHATERAAATGPAHPAALGLSAANPSSRSTVNLSRVGTEATTTSDATTSKTPESEPPQ